MFCKPHSLSQGCIPASCLISAVELDVASHAVFDRPRVFVDLVSVYLRTYP